MLIGVLERENGINSPIAEAYTGKGAGHIIPAKGMT